MMGRLLPALCLLYVFIASQSVQTGTIGAFNVEVFGRSKLKKPGVLDTIADVVRRNDIILIQEIRDKSQVAIHELLERVNAGGDHHYAMKLSERLGNSPQKEQYAYLYRPDRVTIEKVYQYPDSDKEFERPPYCALVKPTDPGTGAFAIIGVHTKPRVSIQETNKLEKVYDAVKSHWGTENALIMGDLNVKKMSKTTLTADRGFHGLIDDDVDTSVRRKNISYDRAIVIGNDNFRARFGSARPYRFDTEPEKKLSKEEALRVSNHFPIEVDLLNSNVDSENEEGNVDSENEEGNVDSENEEDMRSSRKTVEKTKRKQAGNKKTQGMPPSRKILPTVDSKKTEGNVDSENEEGNVDSKNEEDMRSSRKTVGKTKRKQAGNKKTQGMSSRRKKLLTVDSKNTEGNVDSKNGEGMPPSRKILPTVDSKKTEGNVDSKNEEGMPPSIKERGPVMENKPKREIWKQGMRPSRRRLSGVSLRNRWRMRSRNSPSWMNRRVEKAKYLG